MGGAALSSSGHSWHDGVVRMRRGSSMGGLGAAGRARIGMISAVERMVRTGRWGSYDRGFGSEEPQGLRLVSGGRHRPPGSAKGTKLGLVCHRLSALGTKHPHPPVTSLFNYPTSGRVILRPCYEPDSELIYCACCCVKHDHVRIHFAPGDCQLLARPIIGIAVNIQLLEVGHGRAGPPLRGCLTRFDTPFSLMG